SQTPVSADIATLSLHDALPILVGPTGVGKTEIARRLAKLVDAPFVKVEATKFTEVGYVGRDVESIVRDLLEASIRLVKEQHTARDRKSTRLNSSHVSSSYAVFC